MASGFASKGTPVVLEPERKILRKLLRKTA